jgi:hypothetical protein
VFCGAVVVACGLVDEDLEEFGYEGVDEPFFACGAGSCYEAGAPSGFWGEEITL